MWGVSLLQTGRVDQAETVLETFTREQGEDGSVLFNLARIYMARGEQAHAEQTLWRALELEPNQENGLGWFAALEREKGGEPASRAALERVAALPGSWRPQLWLAREELAAGNLDLAKNFYSEALSRAPQPPPPELMMQMSGDLGQHGHLAEMIELTAPSFLPELHGIPVGSNLIKALVDSNRIPEAAGLVGQMEAYNRPDWSQALTFWRSELAKRGVYPAGQAPQPAPQQAPQQEIQIGMLRVDGPVWLPPQSPAWPLFGGLRQAAGPSVTFLGGSGEAPPEPQHEALQAADALGRMTRLVPLFLAEQVEMRTAARGRAMLPWAVGTPVTHPSGFVVSGARWPDEMAVQAGQQQPNQSASDYVATIHIDAEVEPWEASLVFVRVADGTRIGELQADFSPRDPGEGLLQLADEVVELLSALGPAATPTAYILPQAFAAYAHGLEQLLTIRCSAMEGVATDFLRGEQSLLDSEIALCVAEPANTPSRVLLIDTLTALSQLRPALIEAMQPAVIRLHEEHPFPAVENAFGLQPE